MADQSNVQLIRDMYDAFLKGDMEAVGNVLADDIVVHLPGRHPLAGDRRSKEEFFVLLGQMAELTSRLSAEVRDVVGGDEHVLGLITEQLERNGKTLSVDVVEVWKVENGKAVEVVTLACDPYALDEFWS
jgi:uncharacterized protein